MSKDLKDIIGTNLTSLNEEEKKEWADRLNNLTLLTEDLEEKNKLVSLKRVLYVEGFMDTLNNVIDYNLMAASDEYQVGNIKAMKFKKELIQESEEMYPYNDGLTVSGDWSKITNIFEKSLGPSKLKELMQRNPDLAKLIEKATNDDIDTLNAFSTEYVTKTNKE